MQKQNSLNHLRNCLAGLLAQRRTKMYLTDRILSNRSHTQTVHTFICYKPVSDYLQGRACRLGMVRKKPLEIFSFLIWIVIILAKKEKKSSCMHSWDQCTNFITSPIPQIRKKSLSFQYSSKSGNFSSWGMLCRDPSSRLIIRGLMD